MKTPGTSAPCLHLFSGGCRYRHMEDSSVEVDESPNCAFSMAECRKEPHVQSVHGVVFKVLERDMMRPAKRSVVSTSPSATSVTTSNAESRVEEWRRRRSEMVTVTPTSSPVLKASERRGSRPVMFASRTGRTLSEGAVAKRPAIHLKVGRRTIVVSTSSSGFKGVIVVRVMSRWSSGRKLVLGVGLRLALRWRWR